MSQGQANAKVRVAMFENAYGVTPRQVALDTILSGIVSGRYATQIQGVRKLFDAWKAVCPTLDCKKSPEAKAYDAIKKKLPAFCVSGTAKSRTEPLEHSGLMQVDCDKLNGTMGPLRERLKDDRHVAFGYVSPSGVGLKLGLAIDGTRHAESFEAAREYFRREYGVTIDEAVKDRLRMCFVSDDPEAWTRDNVEPLPLPESSPVEVYEPTEGEKEAANGGELSGIILPSGEVSISESAQAIFQRIAPSQTLFWRGGALVELVEIDGMARLEVLKPEAFRSRVERYGRVFAWRSDGGGRPVLRQTKMPRDDAAAIMAAAEARELLPPIASVLRCPVLVESSEGEVTILGRGYHSELGGLLIVAGDEPQRVELSEAVASLKWLFEEFHFQSEGDRSRALAAVITPSLRIGGFLKGNIPMDVAEANDSQAGKGYRQSMTALLYNEVAYPVTQRQGGVGSFDESFASALLAARPFITLENVRGRLASQHIEGFLTSPEVFDGTFVARVPGLGEQTVNSRRFLLQLSSNGLESTIDLANRASICRTLKRHGFVYRDTRGELQRRQPYFLGCVFAVISEWISNGKPRTSDTRHDFREWSQILNWIVQNILGCVPLMDGHQAAQERSSNPALSWLRTVALAVSGDNRLGVVLIATEIVEICELHMLEIPGKPDDVDKAKKQVGKLFKQIFRSGDSVEVDGFTVTRSQKKYHKPSGDSDTTNAYTFTK